MSVFRRLVIMLGSSASRLVPYAAQCGMLDLLIKNCALPDGRTGMSVAVAGGKIVEVAAGLAAPAKDTVEANGWMLAPPFCDPHFHMDTTLTYGQPRVNESGTLLEGIAVWGELKPSLKADAIIERA